MFSSNREGIDRLYVSSAAEVYEQSTRDASRLNALANPWLWAGLFCGALLVWACWLLYSRMGTVADKVWPARFSWPAFSSMPAFVFLLFLWKLPGLVDAIVEQFQEPIPASRIVDETELQSQQTQENLYSKVADLPAVEPQNPNWSGEASTTPRLANPDVPQILPENNTLPRSNQIPAHVPQTIVAVTPQPRAPQPATPQQLTRSQPKPSLIGPPEEVMPALPPSKPIHLSKSPRTIRLRNSR